MRHRDALARHVAARVCLAAVAHLLRWATSAEVSADLSHLAGCIKSLGTLEKNVLRNSWGCASSQQPTDIAKIPLVTDLTDADTGDGTEASTSETTSSSSGNTSDEESSKEEIHLSKAMAEQVEWIAPLRSKFLHCRRQDAPLEVDAAWCNSRTYAVGYTTGVGLSTAPTTTRTWCSSCVTKTISTV